MTFEQFLNKIISIFINIINWVGTILNNLMNNYVFMIIIYSGIVILIISTIMEIIGIIKDKANNTQKDKGN